MEITENLVKELVAEQFPELTYLEIRQVQLSGHDNKIFHLGDEMMIRMPSAKCYASQVLKEQEFLPKLSPFLSFPIPRPLFLGNPSKKYPFNWSIYSYLDGDSVSSLSLNNIQLENLAHDLAKFLKELHKINTSNGPPPGLHNYWRGDAPYVYDNDTRRLINKLSNEIDVSKAIETWEKAISSKFNQDLVWVHGDFASGNILTRDGRLSAVIDFGCMAVGDPACDLVIAWTLLKVMDRQIFKDNLSFDEDTWTRAKGWALWKALVTLENIDNKVSPDALKQLHIINEVYKEQ
jgi:aminoglycoside phosphotransferase (APT) family kinase protein